MAVPQPPYHDCRADGLRGVFVAGNRKRFHGRDVSDGTLTWWQSSNHVIPSAIPHRRGRRV